MAKNVVSPAEISVRQEQEIIAYTVDMGQDLRPVQTVETVKQRDHMGLHFRIILKKFLLIPAAQRLIEPDPLSDIKRMVHMELRIMKLFHKCHAPHHIIPVPRIAVARPLIILGDLVAGFPVHI